MLHRIILALLRPQYAAIAGAAATAYSAYTSNKNSKRSASGQGTGYQPGNPVSADEKWLNAMAAIKNATDRNTGMVDPVLLQSYSQMLGIDLSQLTSAGAMQGQQYGQLGDTAGYYGDVMGGRANEAFGRGDALWNTAQDPQQALYERSKQNIVEGARAADSARGIGMSGVSAGNENKAVRDFEIDWQGQQLARMLGGSEGANRAGMRGGQDLSSSMGYYGAIPGYTMSSATAPIQAQQTQYQLPMDWSTMFTQGQANNIIGPQQAMQANILPYLGLGVNAGAYGAQNALAQRQFRNLTQQQNLGNFVGAAQGLQGAYNNYNQQQNSGSYSGAGNDYYGMEQDYYGSGG